MSAKSKSSIRSPISLSMVSAPTPNSFVHVAHVGINKQGAIEASKGVDPSWKAVLSGLQFYGNDVPDHYDFADGFRNSVENTGRTNSSETTIVDTSENERKSKLTFLILKPYLTFNKFQSSPR